MGAGTAALSTSQKKEQAGAPFAAGAANNGLSVSAAGKIVLGNDQTGVAGAAQLLSEREIATNNHSLTLFNGANNATINDLNIAFNTPTKSSGFFADNLVLTDNATSGTAQLFFNNLAITDGVTGENSLLSATLFEINNAGVSDMQLTSADLTITDGVSGNFSVLTSQALQLVVGANSITLNDNITVQLGGFTSTIFGNSINSGGTLRSHNAASIVDTNIALTNYGAAALGTLANAPTAGNPAKWIAINDNGTLRKIPTWL